MANRHDVIIWDADVYEWYQQRGRYSALLYWGWGVEKWNGLSLVSGLGGFPVTVLPNPKIEFFGDLGLYPQDDTFYTDVVTTPCMRLVFD